VSVKLLLFFARRTCRAVFRVLGANMAILGLSNDNLPPFLGDDGEMDVYQIDGLINGIANGVALAMGICEAAETLGNVHLDEYGDIWRGQDQERPVRQ
jgi:hypothetical protein